MGCHELDCEWRGKQLRVVTYGGLRSRRQLWIDNELADEVSSTPWPLRYPLLCARVEVNGEFHDVDVVHERRPLALRRAVDAAWGVKILVDGDVVYGDAYASPRLLIEPRIWTRVHARGFWAYAIAESPRGVLWLAPAILLLLLQGLELGPTIVLVSLASLIAFIVMPSCVWLSNEARWRSRQRLLQSAQTHAAARRHSAALRSEESLASVEADRRVALPERA